MDELDEMALVMIPADDLPPGTTQTVEVTFAQPAANGEFYKYGDMQHQEARQCSEVYQRRKLAHPVPHRDGDGQ